MFVIARKVLNNGLNMNEAIHLQSLDEKFRCKKGIFIIKQVVQTMLINMYMYLHYIISSLITAAFFWFFLVWIRRICFIIYVTRHRMICLVHQITNNREEIILWVYNHCRKPVLGVDDFYGSLYCSQSILTVVCFSWGYSLVTHEPLKNEGRPLQKSVKAKWKIINHEDGLPTVTLWESVVQCFSDHDIMCASFHRVS